jgi:hypothetical protein
MKSRTSHAISTLVLLVFACSASAVAGTVAVGSCLPRLASYTTISEAVAAVPAGSIIDVCPGTYSETVQILQALTLQGVSSADGDLVVISGGGDLTAALAVIAAGPVNISNIQVQLGPDPSASIGIKYTGASGTLNHVSVAIPSSRPGEQIGIQVVVNDGSSQTVSIRNSDISMSTGALQGIEAGAGPGTLALTIQDNTIVAPVVADEGVDIAPCCGGTVTATIQGNFIDSFRVGIISGGGLTISGNTIVNSSESGISSATGDTVTGNNLIGNGTGILSTGQATTYAHNTITNSTIGIDLGCSTTAATGNTFNNDTTGFNNVPPLFGTATNIFYAVSTIRGAACP